MNNQYKQPEEVKIEDVKLETPVFLDKSIGVFETVTAAPTGTPTNMINQIKIYTNGSTYRLYWYDAKNNVWHYVTATA
ncbi:hypothetical protein M0R04_14165 [Candidatus Dojkabacteria bacterium]|jgi:hypothetical protein|nr:hypothetical protein [Candidatus Dojkabacteria bacterium]